MRTNANAFQWTRTRERAALLVSEDALTDREIADRCRIHPATLERWKKRSEFAARVQQHVAAFREKIRAEGLVNRQNRVDALNDRWERMQRVIMARAEEHCAIPGGDTGLLVKQKKSVGFGEHNQIVEEYAVDTGLLKELRAHEEQAAKELGQWAEKHEHTGKDGGPIQYVETIIERPAGSDE